MRTIAGLQIWLLAVILISKKNKHVNDSNTNMISNKFWCKSYAQGLRAAFWFYNIKEVNMLGHVCCVSIARTEIWLISYRVIKGKLTNSWLVTFLLKSLTCKSSRRGISGFGWILNKSAHPQSRYLYRTTQKPAWRFFFLK